MRSRLGSSHVLLLIAGVPSLGCGILAGAVWLNNAVVHSRDSFVGQVDIFGLTVVADGRSLGWTAGALVAFGAFAIWTAHAQAASDE